jgi:ABC-type bacteriocin/lantibiotic exporter with double-glycine peptidase domain
MIDISQRFFDYLAGADLRDCAPPKPRDCGTQLHGGSCVAACARMLLKDFGVEQPEAYIRAAIGVDALEGGYLSNVPAGLKDLEFPREARYHERLTLPELRWHTATNAALVGVKLEGYGFHALVVDGFEGDDVRLRDPLPVGTGSSYKVGQEYFCEAWQGKAVVVI